MQINNNKVSFSKMLKEFVHTWDIDSFNQNGYTDKTQTCSKAEYVFGSVFFKERSERADFIDY